MKAKTKKVKIVHIPKKYFDAVDNGVKFLDLTFGRKVWLKKMDMSNFNIRDEGLCVAGNVFRDAMFGGSEEGFNSFLQAVDALAGGKDRFSVQAYATAARFGFYTSAENGFQYLQDIWVKRINRMRKAAGIK